LSNRSIMMEVEERSNFTVKKTKKQRQKEEQERVKPSIPSPVLKTTELEDEPSGFSDDHWVEVVDYEELSEDFDF